MTTLNDVLDAMEKNGYKKVKNEFIRYEGVSPHAIVGACAIGQAALNLGKEPEDVDDITLAYLCDAYGGRVANIWRKIPKMNDETNKRVPTIAKEARKAFIEAGVDLNLTISYVDQDDWGETEVAL